MPHIHSDSGSDILSASRDVPPSQTFTSTFLTPRAAVARQSRYGTARQCYYMYLPLRQNCNKDNTFRPLPALPLHLARTTLALHSNGPRISIRQSVPVVAHTQVQLRELREVDHSRWSIHAPGLVVDSWSAAEVYRYCQRRCSLPLARQLLLSAPWSLWGRSAARRRTDT